MKALFMQRMLLILVGVPQMFRHLFAFKDPRMALMALGAAVFALLLAMDTTPAVEKLGFTLGMGLGIGYIAVAAKAFLGGRYSNLGLLMGVLGLLMVYVSITNTPYVVFASSALDDYAILLVAAIIGLFSKVEEG